ncbi:hypothetical protein Nepgr_000818 [Nepenthes gracilis]|uniref:Uncharacterized protein n=1 Tax=Nepenthes gracilis TaxID=150966 RepID=A0AAD3P3G5_NEPGR|nr:hypothetical protein Nepgr_000818 [Nepenthes gracilis]
MSESLRRSCGHNLPVKSTAHSAVIVAFRGCQYSSERFLEIFMEMESLCSNAVLLERLASYSLEALVVESVAAAAKSFCLLRFLMGTLPSGSFVLPQEPDMFKWFVISEQHEKKQSDPENKDADEEDEDEGEEDEKAADDDDDNGGDDDGDEGNDEEEGNLEDKPEANGEGDEEDEDEDDDDDDDDDDDEDGGEDEDDEEEDEDDEDEEEDDEDEPPTKKRKGA